jgi:hypothetical protein
MKTVAQITDNIRKLIRVAQDNGATENERERAMSLAHKLLAKHNLDLAAIVAASDDIEPDVLDTQTEVRVEFYMSPASRMLCASIAGLYFCKYMFVKRSKTHVFIGEPGNATTASMIAEFVALAIDKEASNTYSHGPMRSSFLYGACARVSERCQELVEASRAMSEPGTSLVLADVYFKQLAKNDEYVAKKYGRTKTDKSRSSVKFNYSAVQQGREYADSLNLRNHVK